MAVFPASVEVQSRHTGSVLEPRPDLVPKVQSLLMFELMKTVRQRGFESIQVNPPASSQPEESTFTRRLAFLGAINESILTHNYEIEKNLVIDYDTGDTPRVLGASNADALLCFYVVAVVPTEGRNALKVTSIIVGALSGIRIHVSTNEAVAILALLDSRDGRVLWFNTFQSEANVQDEDQLRKFVKKASEYLLKPRK